MADVPNIYRHNAGSVAFSLMKRVMAPGAQLRRHFEGVRRSVKRNVMSFNPVDTGLSRSNWQEFTRETSNLYTFGLYNATRYVGFIRRKGRRRETRGRFICQGAQEGVRPYGYRMVCRYKRPASRL